MADDGNQQTDVQKAQEAAARAEKALTDARNESKAASDHATKASDAAKQTKVDSSSAKLAASDAQKAAANNKASLYVTTALTMLCLFAAFGVGGKIVFAKATPGEDLKWQICALVCFLGAAFACLGFGLFLVGASGAFKGSTSGTTAINVETAAPGLVVIVCATIVIYFALGIVKPDAPAPPAAAAAAGSGSAAAKGSNAPASGSNAPASGSNAPASGSSTPPAGPPP